MSPDPTFDALNRLIIERSLGYYEALIAQAPDDTARTRIGNAKRDVEDLLDNPALIGSRQLYSLLYGVCHVAPGMLREQKMPRRRG